MLKIGVIGCGDMGRDHIRRITERIQGAEVVAVSNRTESRAREGAAIAGCSKIYADSRELIHDPEVDAVLIASAGFLHYADLMEAIRAGKRISVKSRSARQKKTAKRLWKRRSPPAGI